MTKTAKGQAPPDRSGACARARSTANAGARAQPEETTLVEWERMALSLAQSHGGVGFAVASALQQAVAALRQARRRVAQLEAELAASRALARMGQAAWPYSWPGQGGES